MAALDGVLESVLALAALVLAGNVAFAVLAWLYAALFVGGSVVALLVALAFVGFGTVILLGFVPLSLRVRAPSAPAPAGREPAVVILNN